MDGKRQSVPPTKLGYGAKGQQFENQSRIGVSDAIARRQFETPEETTSDKNPADSVPCYSATPARAAVASEKAASRAPSQSTAALIKRKDIEAEKHIMNLREELQEYVQKKEVDMEMAAKTIAQDIMKKEAMEIEMEGKTIDDMPQEFRMTWKMNLGEINNGELFIKGVRESIQRRTTNVEEKIAAIRRIVQLEKEEIALTEDDEQALGTDDLRKVHEWREESRQVEMPTANAPLEVVHSPHVSVSHPPPTQQVCGQAPPAITSQMSQSQTPFPATSQYDLVSAPSCSRDLRSYPQMSIPVTSQPYRPPVAIHNFQQSRYPTHDAIGDMARDHDQYPRAPGYTNLGGPIYTSAALGDMQPPNPGFVNAAPQHQRPQGNPDATIVQQLTTALSQAFGQHNNRAQDLPIFNGRAEEWPVFHNEYVRTSVDCNVANSENIIRLRRALKGPAKEAVKALLDDPACVPEIINTLYNRFGRPELIIKSLIKEVKDAKPPDANKPESVINFGTVVRNLVARVNALGEHQYLYDVTLLEELVSKLPVSYAGEWISWLMQNPTVIKNLESFSYWMRIKVSIMEQLHQPKIPALDVRSNKPEERRRGVHAAKVEDKPDLFCYGCNRKGHTIHICRTFKKQTVNERWDSAKKAQLCFKCLEKGHSLAKCPDKRICDEDGCGKPHHVLLHRASKPIRDSSPTPNPPTKTEEKETLKEEKTGHLGTAKASVSLPMVQVQLKGPNGVAKVYAILDTGASLSMLEESVADNIGLKGEKRPLRFTVFGEDVRESSDSRVIAPQISATGRRPHYYDLQDVRTVTKLGIPGGSVKIDELKKKYPYLKGMKGKSINSAVPQMLIGCNHFRLFLPQTILEPKDTKGPVACKSRLGWYVVEDQGSINNISLAYQEDWEKLHLEMKEFFSTENLGVKVTQNSDKTKDEKRALQMLEEKTTLRDGRWESGLLWKNDGEKLPESKSMALRRLKTMEKKMDADPEFAELCLKKFADYQAKGYLVPTKRREDESRRWYLPWFFAYHPTKKPRLVFDAAAKAGAKSLNDFLLKGPDMLQSLAGVIMRYRLNLIAISADIKEMYHQVRMMPEDQPSHTLLFRGMDRVSEPQEMEMTVICFGSKSSQSTAIYAKQKNAERFADEFPAAVKSTTRNFYSDDYLGGADTVDEAVMMQQQITYIHLEGGFPVVKWNSSSKQVLNAIPEDLRAIGDMPLLKKDDVITEKTLGLYWTPNEDAFKYQLSFNKVPKEIVTGQERPTKRQVASLVMALFDPLGFIAPYRIKGLILLQHVWKSGVDWKDEISSAVYEEWKHWLRRFPELENIRIPRCYSPISLKNARDIQLHVFCDASEEAFATAAYLRIDNGESVITPLVWGKSRVAPLKGLTIPRMELQAALAGGRLGNTIQAELDDVKLSKVTYWTDSKTVLCWIRATSSRFNQFVMTRVGELQETTDTANWRWVPTKENVADDATRLRHDADLSSSSRWLTGPAFLKEPEEMWPRENKEKTLEDVDEDALEVRPAVFVAVEDSSERLTDPRRFSSWLRLIRSTAALYLWIRLHRKIGPCYITVEDMKKAELYHIRQSQLESFPEEMSLLKKKQPIKASSKLKGLSVGINDAGIMVLMGRIDGAKNVSETVKQPPILHPGHTYTQLFIHWIHCAGAHYGKERVAHEVRQRAWVINCKEAVRRCCDKCWTCKVRRAKPQQPLMGQLPAARLGDGHYPFHHTGVDYFGPYLVTINRRLQKRWGVIFTCMSSRAVHLELSESLDTSEFINALTRLISIRGRPAHMYSDNGTNFVGADKEIRAALLEWNQDFLHDTMAAKGIEWHFNPPAAPHMGGSWERLVGSVKKVLSYLLKSRNPRESVLRTLFCEVMEILNNRPLTYVSTSPEDSECITPNHILRLKCVNGPSIPGKYEEHDMYTRSWKYAQYLADEFWRRWTREYLPGLARREKWNSPVEPLKVGDVVLVVDDQMPRSSWKKGVIEMTFPAKDGQVRRVLVKVANVSPEDVKKKVQFTSYIRPAAKVCPLGLPVEVVTSHEEGEYQPEL